MQSLQAPTQNKYLVPFITKIGPLSFLSPLECAQSVFRVCRSLNFGGYNWDHLKVVPLELKGDGWRVISNDLQDCGCFRGSYEMCVPLRNEKLQAIPIENSAHLCDFPNKPVEFMRSVHSTVKAYGLTDEGLKIQSSLTIENAPPGLFNISNLFCEEASKDKNEKRVVRKLQLTSPNCIGICSQTDNGTWQFVRHQKLDENRIIGQVLFSQDGSASNDRFGSFYDLANRCAPLKTTASLMVAKAFMHYLKPHGTKQLMFLPTKKLIVAEKRNGELTHKWSWQEPEATLETLSIEERDILEIRPTDNNWLVVVQILIERNTIVDTQDVIVDRTYVLNVSNGETVFTFKSGSYIQFWLKRNVVFYETADHALHILKPVRQLDKRIKYVSAQLLPADKNPIETVLYRMFLPLQTNPLAQHKLFVFRKIPQDQ